MYTQHDRCIGKNWHVAVITEAFESKRGFGGTCESLYVCSPPWCRRCPHTQMDKLTHDLSQHSIKPAAIAWSKRGAVWPLASSSVTGLWHAATESHNLYGVSSPTKVCVPFPARHPPPSLALHLPQLPGPQNEARRGLLRLPVAMGVRLSPLLLSLRSRSCLNAAAFSSP